MSDIIEDAELVIRWTELTPDEMDFDPVLVAASLAEAAVRYRLEEIAKQPQEHKRERSRLVAVLAKLNKIIV